MVFRPTHPYLNHVKEEMEHFLFVHVFFPTLSNPCVKYPIAPTPVYIGPFTVHGHVMGFFMNVYGILEKNLINLP